MGVTKVVVAVTWLMVACTWSTSKCKRGRVEGPASSMVKSRSRIQDDKYVVHISCVFGAG